MLERLHGHSASVGQESVYVAHERGVFWVPRSKFAAHVHEKEINLKEWCISSGLCHEANDAGEYIIHRHLTSSPFSA